MIPEAYRDVNGNRVLDFPDWMVRLGPSPASIADPAAASRTTTPLTMK